MKALGFLAVALILAGSAFSQNAVSTYAGNGTQGFVNGDTLAARFKTPFGLCKDKSKNIYVADAGNNCIRKITPAGIVSTFAGDGIAGYKDTVAAFARFNNPTNVCADDAGNIFVSDFLNQRIRKISLNGSVTTIAGNGIAGYADGQDTAARFNYPRGIAVDQIGNLYISDSWNHRIRKISPTGLVSTYAGGGTASGPGSIGALVDATDTVARFYTPSGIAYMNGNVFVADAYNHRIRKIDALQQVTTVVGSGATGTGNGGFADGPLASGRLNTPTELLVTASGDIYIGDTFNNRVRKASNGQLSTVAGKGNAGYQNGIDSLALFNYPRGLVLDSLETTLLVVDYNNHSIRKIVFNGWNGIGELLNSPANVLVYPNPNFGSFDLLPDGIYGPLVIEIMDAAGRTVYYAGQNRLGKFDLRALEPGAYTIKISGDGIAGVARFIKE